MRLRLYWLYAFRSLIRGGQRTILAAFCIAVGVMAIVALQLVGLSINDALTSNIVEANGGDLRLDTVLLPLNTTDLPTFAQLKSQGKITDYATSYEIPSSITKSDGIVTPFDLVAVSNNYPLVGQANFTNPARNLRIQDAVTGNSVAVNVLVYDLLKAHIGDIYTLRTSDGQVLPVTIAAEFDDGGAFHGPQVIVSAATLATVPGPNNTSFPQRFTTITMTTTAANILSVQDQLRNQYTTATVTTAADELRLRQQDVSQIRLFLQIVGLLALFIGGIGIINTMQVLLRRRRTEIAMLKTMGFRQRDLYILFGLEATLLGILGSLVGAGLGIGASYAVRAIVEQAFFLHLQVFLDIPTIAAGCLVGVATAVIFGLLPIVQASRIRPLAVLREQETANRLSLLTSGGLLIALSLLFVGLATAILGNVIYAVAVIYGGVALVGVLAGGFSLLVTAISRLPVYDRPRFRMFFWVLGAAILAGGTLTGLYLVVQQLQGTDIVYAARSGHLQPIYGLIGGAAVLLIIAGGTTVLLLATIVDAIMMFTPRTVKTTLMLAYRNIGRQRGRTTATVTALFVGVFGIGVILLLGQGIKDAINSTISTVFAHNLFVVTTPLQSSTVAQTASGLQGVDNKQTVVNAIARVIPISAGDQTLAQILTSGATQGDTNASFAKRQSILLSLSVVEGFNVSTGKAIDIPKLKITDGRNLVASDAGTDEAVLNNTLTLPPTSLHIGDTIVVQSGDAKTKRTLTIVGFFDRISTTDFIPGEILVDTSTAESLGGALTQDIISLRVDTNQTPAIRQKLSQAVPTAQVVSLTDLSAIIDRILNNLIVMLTAIASLAMIAGLVIIANAVALAMTERRREIGILKSVGHTSRSVLAMVLIENGIISLLGSLVALLLVAGIVLGLGAFVFHRNLQISLPIVEAILGVTISLTLIVAALVAWGATRVRPLEVLRYD